MISNELLKELKQILWEDYKIQLADSDLKLFAENLKGLFSLLVQALSKKQKKLNLTINNNDNDKQPNTSISA